MATSNAERQRRWVQRLKDKAAAASPDERDALTAEIAALKTQIASLKAMAKARAKPGAPARLASAAGTAHRADPPAEIARPEDEKAKQQEWARERRGLKAALRKAEDHIRELERAGFGAPKTIGTKVKLLAKHLRLIGGSDNPNEVMASIGAAKRALKAAGYDWNTIAAQFDVAAEPPRRRRA